MGWGTDLALRFCADLGVKGTWFCLADQAKRHPELVTRILADGHVLALHGLDHRRAFTFDRTGFRSWLREGRCTLEDLSGNAIRGFRAPEWSLRGGAEDYWELLAAEGFAYDASRAPVPGLGRMGWPRRVHNLGKGLREVPPMCWGPLPLWGWPLRLGPETLMKRAILCQAGKDTPALVLHPWELDEGQPPLPTGALTRFVHGAGLKDFGARLRRIFADLPLAPIEHCLGLGGSGTLEAR